VKKPLIVIGIVIAVLLLLIAAFAYVIKRRTSPGDGRSIAAQTMPAEGICMNIFNGVADLRNITVGNPEEFRDRVFVSVRQLYVRADPAALTGKGTPRLREVRIDVAQALIVRERNGRYNFQVLLDMLPEEKEKEVEKEAAKFRIDRLRVVFDNLVFLDYTARGDKPLFIRFDIDMDKTYSDIDDAEEFRSKVIGDFIANINVGEIRNFELINLVDIARSALNAVPDDTRTRIFGPGKEREPVLEELGSRFGNRIKELTGK
jgi:hypothetical protein